MLFEFVHHTQRLHVVLEAAKIHHAFVERILARVPERRVPQVVSQANGFRQHFVQTQCARDGACNLSHLERMREPGPKQVSLMIDEHLGFVDQPAKYRGMHDSIAVALIFGAIRGRRFRMAAAAGTFFVCGIRRQLRHAQYSARVASSVGCPYAPVTTARPRLSRSTRRTVPDSTFLSICINSNARDTPIRGTSVGSPARNKRSRMRACSVTSIHPRRRDKLAAINMPRPTASPCR